MVCVAQKGIGKNNMISIAILGSRGIPARYGGFETFAEELAIRLTKRNISVTVYCESDGPNEGCFYKGIKLVYIPIKNFGPATTIIFDILSLWDARKDFDVVYMLGYGAAPFCFIPRMWGSRVWLNVDGIEWARAKWNRIARCYFKFMEFFSMWTPNHVIADAEGIKDHLHSRHLRVPPCSVIPYGAPIIDTAPVSDILCDLGLRPFQYYLVVARIEPENHIIEIIEGYKQSKTCLPLIVVGNHQAGTSYANKVVAVAGDGVSFVGGIYDKDKLISLRYYSSAYFHGHSVGGTNPSLLEALGCGNLVIAHDNKFNREVLGKEGHFFVKSQDIPQLIENIESLKDDDRVPVSGSAKECIRLIYNWDKVAESYFQLLHKEVP